MFDIGAKKLNYIPSPIVSLSWSGKHVSDMGLWGGTMYIYIYAYVHTYIHIIRRVYTAHGRTVKPMRTLRGVFFLAAKQGRI